MARRSLLMVCAVLIAAVGTALIVLYVRGIDARAAEGQQLVRVLTATEVIDPGESVQHAQASGKLETREVSRTSAADGALSSAASIDDLVALGTIYPGEQIMAAKFGEPGAEETLTIPEDKLAISVELTDPARVAGFVSPGAHVAIFVSADPEVYLPDGETRRLPQYTGLLLPEVQVIGVGTTTVQTRTVTSGDGQKTTEEIPRTILTVAVEQREAEKVIFASRNGELAFALLNEESQVTRGRGITAQDVMPRAFGRGTP
jgi:pilus assembly protein CpaB